MIINLLYRQLYDMHGERVMIGGVETYITNLIKLFKEHDYDVYVYQFANVQFEREFLGAKVIGVAPRNKIEHIYINRIHTMIKEAYRYSDTDRDILLFCTENDIVKSRFKKVIAIQHGIGWDVHNLGSNSNISVLKFWLRNSQRAFNEYSQFRHCDTLVCVDYNFVNWYRTIVHDDKLNYKVIPNFSILPEFREQKEKETVSVIFARRFQTYRGTKIFAEAVSKLLCKYDNVIITIAGEGPEAEYLHNKLDIFSQVCFTRFTPNESIKIHSGYDIAVVPSTASEGTSLSLIEAMAAGCAVICTDIGGLTNIIVDGHNGMIIRPNTDELYNALDYLICNHEERVRLAKEGYETVKDSFDLASWSKKWINVIESV